MSQRLFLGFDPGLAKPAFVVTDQNSKLVEYGWFPVEALSKGASPIDKAKRVKSITDQLFRKLMEYEPEQWAIEGYAYNEKFQAHPMGELGGVVRYRALHYYTKGDLEFPIVVAPRSLKKFATGKGTGDKSIIGRDVFASWGWRLSDNNQYDAAVCAQVARAMAGANNRLESYQAEVLQTLRRGGEE